MIKILSSKTAVLQENNCFFVLSCMFIAYFPIIAFTAKVNDQRFKNCYF